MTSSNVFHSSWGVIAQSSLGYYHSHSCLNLRDSQRGYARNRAFRANEGFGSNSNSVGAREVILTPAGVAEVHCANAASRICVLSEDLGKQKTFSIVDPVRGRLELAKLDTPGVLMTQWSLFPDGSKMALMGDQSDNVNVRVFDLRSKQAQVIHPTPPQKLLQKLAWSADGSGFSFQGSRKTVAAGSSKWI